ncbi:MAG: WD40 repeat domain-containing protein [Gemmataceae bacterium]
MSRCTAFMLLGLLAGAEPGPFRDRYGDPLPDGALARLGTMRQRVGASQLALSVDGRTIVTVTGGRMVGRWDAATGRLREFHRLPGSPVAQSWLSSDGRLLAAAEAEERLAIFDTESGVRKRIVPGRSVAFAPGGRSLVTIENGKTNAHLHLWDRAAGKDRLQVKLPSDINNFHIYDFAFSADGKRLFAAAYLIKPMYVLYSLRCWDLDSGKEVWKTEAATGCHERVTVSPDGHTLCSNSSGASDLHLCDAGTGRHLGDISTGKDWRLGRIAFAPDGRTGFVVTSRDILLWDTATRAVRHRLAGAGYSYAVAPDSKTLLSLAGTQLRRWDVATGKLLYLDTAGDGHTDAVCGLVFAPNGQSIVTIGGDETIRTWELATQRPRTLLRSVLPRYGSGSPSARSPDSWRTTFYPLQNLAVTSDGRHLLSGGRGELRLSDIRTGEQVRRFEVRNANNRPSLGTARLSDDGRTLWTLPHPDPDITGGLISSERKETLIGWDVATGRRLSEHDVAWRGDFVGHVIAPDGRSVALENGGLRDVASGEDRLKEGQRLSHPFAFSADSRLVAAADLRSQDHWDTIAIHELLTGRRLIRLEAPISWSSRFAFSPDGRLLIAFGADALHVWEVSSGRRLLHLVADGRLPAWLPGAFGTCLTVAPDGRSAATGHEDGTVLVWDLAPAWKRLAERPVAPLTPVQLDTCWADLLKDDPRAAYASIDRLTTASVQTLTLLRKHLRPVTIDPQWLRRRLADLDSSEFAVRDKASRDLEGVVEAIQPRLQRELEQTSSLEVRSRLRRLLEAPRIMTPPPDVVRRLRGLVVLERIATPEARDLLRELAKGEERDPLTRAAHAALNRMAATHAP